MTGLEAVFFFALFWGSAQITTPMSYESCQEAKAVAAAETDNLYMYCLPVKRR